MRNRLNFRLRESLSSLFVIMWLTISIPGQVNTIPDSQSQTNLGGANQITGTVFGPSGRPAESRVSVRLATMTRGDRTAITNETGNFAFRGLPTGTYTVVIDKEKDFEPYTTTVDVRQFRGGPPQLVTLNIRLVQRAPITAKPAVITAEFASVPPAAQSHYFRAVEHGQKRDHIAAINELKLAIAEHPTFSLAFNEMGVQYLRINQPQDADNAFLKALDLDTTLFAALVNRGIANVLMKRYGEAVPILRKAVKKNEQSAVAHYFLGQALANLGLFSDAEKELLISLDLGKEQMREAHRILAIIYGQRGDIKRATTNLEIYLRLNPNASDAEQLRQKIKQWNESGE